MFTKIFGSKLAPPPPIVTGSKKVGYEQFNAEVELRVGEKVAAAFQEVTDKIQGHIKEIILENRTGNFTIKLDKPLKLTCSEGTYLGQRLKGASFLFEKGEIKGTLDLKSQAISIDRGCIRYQTPNDWKGSVLKLAAKGELIEVTARAGAGFAKVAASHAVSLQEIRSVMASGNPIVEGDAPPRKSSDKGLVQGEDGYVVEVVNDEEDGVFIPDTYERKKTAPHYDPSPLSPSTTSSDGSESD